MILDYDKYSLKINNKPLIIKSAAFHYFRNPGSKAWKDRLSKLKACGYNTVDLYFSWAYHSSQSGVYDFTGIKDIRELLDIIADLEMFVIARPGPYINAESSAGGLPPWLFNIPDMVLRNRKECNFIYSKSYMHAVREWYSRIIPIINEYNNVIAFQIENEYATNQAEPDYIQELYDMARELGIKAPIFHNDAFCGCLYSDIVNIYAFDIYPTIDFSYNWRENPDAFGNLDYAEENLKDCKPDSPLYIAELQSGWFDRWGGYGYEFIREQLGRKHINIMTKTALSQGITMFNHFLACGGTSWGQLASAEVYTSYDFAAPISEYGIPQENYYQSKEINYFLNAFNLAQTSLISNENEILENEEQENIFVKLRKDHINNCEWLFIRNLNPTAQSIQLKNNNKVNLKPFDMKILPQNLDLFACKVDFSSLSIFARIIDEGYEKIFLILDENSEIILSNFDSAKADKPISSEVKENNLKIEFNEIPKDDLFSCKFFKNNKTTEFIFIKHETADKTWIKNNKAIIGPEFLTENNTLAGFKDNCSIKTIDIKNETTKDISIEKQTIEISPLKFKSYKCAPEIDNNFDCSNWNLIAQDKLFDNISNEIYSEFIWYKGFYEGIIKQININAKHCWAVYLNGKQIYEHDSLHYKCGQDLYEEITINIHNADQHKEITNQITVLVQNMGFDKGFQNPPNLPRGIINFNTNPEKEIEWRIRGNLTPEIEEWFFMHENLEDSAENSYLTWISAEFNINNINKTFAPFYLELNNPPFDKANIFFNGYQIGRYWKNKGPQNRFFLPEGFLKSKNTIGMVIWDKNQNQQIHDFNLENINVNIKIGNIDNYSLIELNDLI